MTADYETLDLPMGPYVRLRMSVAEEMRLDTDNEVFTDELQAKYISMHSEAEKQQQASFKGVILADVGLALILFGKNVKIPGTDLGLQDIPAATEVLTVLASFCFLALCQSFANTQSYQAILEQFSNRKALKHGIDPDYLTFGDVLSQVYLKAFRAKMNNFGADFYVPRRPYLNFYGFVTLMLALSWASILVLHLTVVGAGVWHFIGATWMWWPFAGAMLVIHLTGLLMNLLLSFGVDAHYRGSVHEARRQEARDHIGSGSLTPH
ncbi:hypothetical protein G6L07_08390 [Agrobacterium rhizogenes]|nr:hypothetical protein [Rhizobium rhizogenes]